jgi:GNAT superfamily N-acetyltransferase
MNWKLSLSETECKETAFLLAMDRSIYKELGEPILYDVGDIWIDNSKCFICINIKGLLKYCYTFQEHRGKGYFSVLYTEIENYLKAQGVTEIKTVATKQAKPIYEKLGYNTTKEFINYFKMTKQL